MSLITHNSSDFTVHEYRRRNLRRYFFFYTERQPKYILSVAKIYTKRQSKYMLSAAEASSGPKGQYFRNQFFVTAPDGQRAAFNFHFGSRKRINFVH